MGDDWHRNLNFTSPTTTSWSNKSQEWKCEMETIGQKCLLSSQVKVSINSQDTRGPFALTRSLGCTRWWTIKVLSYFLSMYDSKVIWLHLMTAKKCEKTFTKYKERSSDQTNKNFGNFINYISTRKKAFFPTNKAKQINLFLLFS